MMTPEQHKLLADQFDQYQRQTSPAEPVFDDMEKQQEWEILELAADAIRLNAITGLVKQARLKFEAAQYAGNGPDGSAAILGIRTRDTIDKGGIDKGGIDKDGTDKAVIASVADDRPAALPSKAPAPIRRLFSPLMQAAAVFVLVIAGAVMLKFSNTRPEGVFAKNYADFDLSVTRGGDAASPLEQAYRDKNWAAVYSDFQTAHTKTQKDYFLTAMAYMQQKNYYEAIGLLKTLIQFNQTREPYFEDEAEYYLAMNYLATGQTALAMPLLDKIKADPRHTFYTRVRSMSQLDLRILELK